MGDTPPRGPFTFTRLKSAPRRREVIGFDVEGCGGPGGFVCGAIAGEYLSEFYADRGAMWEALQDYASQGAWVFAHNLEYDLPIVAGEGVFDGELLFKGSGLLWATYRVHGQRARLYDSGNLFPRWGVAALGKMISRDKLEVPRSLLSRLSAGVRWGDLTDPERCLVEQYCRRDAEIVCRAVSVLQEMLLSLGGQLQPTIAGCAMDLYRRQHLRWPWKAVPSAVNRLARPAFYGGRVENYAFGRVEGVNAYDANSLYPYVQSVGRFPHPASLRLREGRAAWVGLAVDEGAGQALVNIPESYIPPLPARLDGRLYFPVGELEGCWTLAELRAAEARGCTVLRLDWTLGSEKLFNPFESFVEDLWRRRQGALVSSEPQAALLKLLLNSLYGRFGLDPDRGLMRLIPLPDDWNQGGYRGYQSGGWNGQAVAYGPLQASGQPAYVNVLFAAQVAAQGRLRLLEGLEGQAESLVYCDTDSILTTSVMSTGDGLGEWRLQAERVTADLVGPKEYALHNTVLGDTYVVKGVPERVAREYLETGSARFRRALSVREAIRQGRNPSEWVEVLRQGRPTLPKRQPALPPWEQRGDYCLTLPWEMGQLRRLHSAPSEWRLAQSRSQPEQYQPVWVQQLAADLRVPVELLNTAPPSD